MMCEGENIIIRSYFTMWSDDLGTKLDSIDLNHLVVPLNFEKLGSALLFSTPSMKILVTGMRHH